MGGENENKHVVTNPAVMQIQPADGVKEKLEGQASVCLGLITGYVNWTSNKQDSYGKPFVSFSLVGESPIPEMTVAVICEKTIASHKEAGFHMFVMSPDAQGKLRNVRIIAYNAEKNMLVASDDAFQEFAVRKFESHFSGKSTPKSESGTAAPVDQGKYFK